MTDNASDTEWRISQAQSRERYLAKFDPDEVDRYHAVVGRLSPTDEDDYLSDLSPAVRFRHGMRILDAGAGTGALSAMLLRHWPGLAISALEPAPAMLSKLRSRAELQGLILVEGFCDSLADRHHFSEAQFDVIASRQLVNGLFDPLAAFRNWHYWLAPDGIVVVIDGLYGRSAWSGVWQEEVDVLPVSACQTTALTPYLLEIAGFRIETLRLMEAVNKLPSTRTERYVVVAKKSA